MFLLLSLANPNSIHYNKADVTEKQENTMKQPLVILTGPTAVGKTKLSIALAKAIDGEIISADSMQVYRHMDIGSAKIRPEEMEGVPHHLIDILDPTDDFHVVRFQSLAKEAMEKIYERNRIPIVVGGTGFYIQALLYDIDFTENEENAELRAELEAFATEKGAEALHQLLKEADPKSAEQIHPNNRKRVIRALEYYRLTGKRISEHNEVQQQKESPYNAAYFVLNHEREQIYKRIDDRVDGMIEEGLLKEVQALKARGLNRGMVSMQGLGYKEMLTYLDGEISFSEAVRILKRDTRHFAKRQLTWFRRERDVIWLNKPDFQDREEDILNYILNVLKEREIIS